MKTTQECQVETMTNGEVVVTVYGDTTVCTTYKLGGPYENKPE